jgi:hypothetical protein
MGTLHAIQQHARMTQNGLEQQKLSQCARNN